MKPKIFSIVFTVLVTIVSAYASEGEKLSATPGVESSIAIRVNDISISESEFEGIFGAAVRHKFYHGRVPENELQVFKKQVAEDLVTQTLVHSEAIASGLEPDRAEIKKGVDAYDSKYANSPEWQSQREKVLPFLMERLERENLINKMESRVKNITQPSENQVREYYLDNTEKFTEPKRVWVSLILLSVPPSADVAMWDEALKTAEQLIKRIENGEEFTELVKAYSSHISAQNGGDLGYLHQGMLDTESQKAVESLAINQISAPVRILEGIALFRLNGIRDSSLKPFDEVKQRAASLLYRALQDKAWSEYVSALKKSANIFIDKKLTILTSHE